MDMIGFSSDVYSFLQAVIGESGCIGPAGL